MKVSVNTQLLKCVFTTADYRVHVFKCLCLYVHVCVLLAVNEKTTKVIEAAFQHARYPSVKGEKSLLFIGKVKYGLDK